MKPLKFLPLLLLGLVFLKQDTSACDESNVKKEDPKKKTEFLARSAFKALKATTSFKADADHDLMIGTSLLRF